MKDLQAYRFWGYATTFGALWGAVEITAGTFLHAMRVPFSGVVLAGIGAALLVTLRSVLPRRGVVLAAGLICAGVKMLSPVGAVVGPMSAILVESLLVEGVLSSAGAGVVPGAIAGGMAAQWTVAQKLIVQSVLYGMPVVGIYKGILQQAEKWLHLPASGGAWAAGIFLGVVALVGSILGASGALVGAATVRQIESASREGRAPVQALSPPRARWSLPNFASTAVSGKAPVEKGL